MGQSNFNQNSFIENRYQMINSFLESSSEYFNKSLRNFFNNSIKAYEETNKAVSDSICELVSSVSQAYSNYADIPKEAKQLIKNSQKNCLDFVNSSNNLSSSTLNMGKKNSDSILNYNFKEDIKKVMNSCKLAEQKSTDNFLQYMNYLNPYFSKNFNKEEATKS